MTKISHAPENERHLATPHALLPEEEFANARACDNA